MKAFLVTFVGLITTAVHSKQLLSSHTNQYPIVQGMGGENEFLIPNFALGRLGIGIKFEGDLYAGYQADFYHLESSTNYLVANPIAYLEAGLRTHFKIILPFMEFTIKANHEGFRYNALDFTFLWSLEDRNQYCYATQWNTRGLRSTVKTVLEVDEC